LSRPSCHDTEHEQAALIEKPALERQRATESLIESSPNPQQDTPDTPDSTRSGDPQAEPRGTPSTHSGEKGEERSDQTKCYKKSLKEATNGALEPASLVEDQQHAAQLRVQDIGEKGNEVDEDERVDGDEGDGEDEEEQTEQVEEKEGTSSTHRVGGNEDREPKTPETPYMKPTPTQNEERLQEDARGSRASNSARVAGDGNNAHDVPSAEELANVQGTASPSETSAVPNAERRRFILQSKCLAAPSTIFQIV
jgi:hypothetical protein